MIWVLLANINKELTKPYFQFEKLIKYWDDKIEYLFAFFKVKS